MKSNNLESAQQANQSAEDEVTEPELNRFHRNPEHEVSLVSCNNIMFRASRHRLMAVSLFFKGLLEIPPPASNNPESDTEPIHLDFYSSTINNYLDLINVSQPFKPTLSIQSASSLLRLLEFTLTENYIKSVRQWLEKAECKRPLELLIVASERNDVELARLAIGRFTIAHIQAHLKTNNFPEEKEGLDKFKDYLRQLRPSFCLGVLFPMLSATGPWCFQTGIPVIQDWSTIAKNFYPVESGIAAQDARMDR
ncbi:uncharacterized protein L201_000807 [Kwoniella dendrophila CBS 6074]|uniref:BTB domain-containing protein n=1 Tax=Kwoniella dendrophila CBS 6074 TaxID=1295534 RepID=A0AAX4JKK7_9TREE